METNETYTQQPNYGPKSVIPQASSTNANSFAQFELLKDMLCGDVIKERDEWKSKYEELKDKNDQKDRIIISQAEDLEECKKKLIHAQELWKTVDECKATGDPRPMFKYEYDLSDFNDEAEIKDVDYIFDCLLCIAEFKLKPEVYLIKNASDIIPIYLVLTRDNKLENTKWQFQGTLEAFCDYWNTNIVPHIEDHERAEKLTCKYPSIKATINKAPWKGTDPISWRRLASDAKKKKKQYQRAFNIKERIVNIITNKQRA